MFQRWLDVAALAADKSVLLLGPRMTGKSTLLGQQLPNALRVDLLDPRELLALSAHPERLAERVSAARRQGTRMIVVDEVQKLPMLLDEVHRLIELDKSLRFVLTGSSARKLRRTPANLLAGRARRAELMPIVTAELGGGARAYERLLQHGGLPSVLTSSEPAEELKDYVGTYLKEEILAEGLSRNLPAFVRFLETAALSNGEQIIYSQIASDAGIPARTVRDHFQLLEDTLLGLLLPSYRRTRTRKAVAAPRFFFFDLGVPQALLSRGPAAAGTAESGRALEHLVFSELRAALSYKRIDGKLSYWRSISQFEVDFILEIAGGPLLAIEVKAAASVSLRDLKGLRAFADDHPKSLRYVVCRERDPRDTDDGIRIRPVERFLDALWSGAGIEIP
jgi:uncharacterized protein